MQNKLIRNHKFHYNKFGFVVFNLQIFFNRKTLKIIVHSSLKWQEIVDAHWLIENLEGLRVRDGFTKTFSVGGPLCFDVGSLIFGIKLKNR